MAGALSTLITMMATAPSMAGVSLLFGEENVNATDAPLPIVVVEPIGGPWDQPGYALDLDTNNETLWGTRERIDIHCWAESTLPTAQPTDHTDAVEALRALVLQALQNQRNNSGTDGNNGGGLFYKAISGRWERVANSRSRFGRCYVLTVEVEISVSDAPPVEADASSITFNVGITPGDDAWRGAIESLNPLAWYRMDAQSGDSLLVDAAGRSQPMQITGAGAWQYQQPSLIASNGSGYSMRALDNTAVLRGDFPTLWTLNGPFTLLYWFLHDPTVVIGNGSVGFDSVGDTLDGLAIDLVGTGSATSATMRVSHGGGVLDSVAGVDISRKRMVSISGNVSTGIWSLFLDGVFVKNGLWNNGGNPWQSFAVNSLPPISEPIGCMYDEIVMIDRGLTPSVMQQLYGLG